MRMIARSRRWPAAQATPVSHATGNSRCVSSPGWPLGQLDPGYPATGSACVRPGFAVCTPALSVAAQRGARLARARGPRSGQVHLWNRGVAPEMDGPLERQVHEEVEHPDRVGVRLQRHHRGAVLDGREDGLGGGGAVSLSRIGSRVASRAGRLGAASFACGVERWSPMPSARSSTSAAQSSVVAATVSPISSAVVRRPH